MLKPTRIKSHIIKKMKILFSPLNAFGEIVSYNVVAYIMSTKENPALYS